MCIKKGRAGTAILNRSTYPLFKRLSLDIQNENFFGETPYEYHLIGKGPEIYFYDFACPELKIIVEYHEDSHKNRSVQIRDNRKRELAEEQGFKVYTLWEDDYLEDPEMEYQKLINWANFENVSSSSKILEFV